MENYFGPIHKITTALSSKAAELNDNLCIGGPHLFLST